MAKARIKTQDGVEVNVEGTPQEIIAIVRDLKAREAKAGQIGRQAKGRSVKGTLLDQIATLADGSFFKQPRDLASVRGALAEMGHHYPITTLSGAMLKLVRRQTLRRMKENKRWIYTRGNKFQ